MRRSDRFAALLLLVAGSAAAHGMHRSDGSFAFEDGRLIVVIEADAGAEGEAAREIVVRDAAGERLPGRIVSADPVAGGDHVACVIEHRLPQEARVVALQLLPREHVAGRSRRLVLSERGGSRSLTLTSGGNVEIVSLTGEIAAAANRDVVGEGDPLGSVHVLMSRRGRRLLLDVVLPGAILEAFVSLPRDADEFLSISEQESSRQVVLDLVTSRAVVTTGGERLDPVVSRVSFLALDAALPPRVAIPVLRARVSLEFEAPSGELSWDFFNPRVHVASCWIRTDTGHVARSLTRSSPSLRWP